MELDAVILGELGRLARFRFDFSRGAGDCFEEVAESPFVDQLDIEVAVVIEELGDIASHKRNKGANNLIGGYGRLGYAITDVLLYLEPVEHLIGGLVGAGRSIAGGNSGVFAVAAVFDVF